jgi:NADH dehydrogenase
VALAGLSDPRGLRAALVGVDTAIHIAPPEGTRFSAARLALEAAGARNLAQAAADARVRRLVYVSHLGADRASAYASLRATALAEEHLRRSGVPSTVLRAAIPYGPGDSFTTSLAMLLAASPMLLPIPGNGSVLLQPLWVEDLARCILWTLEEPSLIGVTLEIGGPELLSLREVISLVAGATGARRILMSTRPPHLRVVASIMERILADPLLTNGWLDYLAANRTTDLDSIPRTFRLQPARMETRLDFLRGRRWGWQLPARLLSREKGRAS